LGHTGWWTRGDATDQVRQHDFAIYSNNPFGAVGASLGFPQTLTAGSQVVALGNTVILTPTPTWVQQTGFTRMHALSQTRKEHHIVIRRIEIGMIKLRSAHRDKLTASLNSGMRLISHLAASEGLRDVAQECPLHEKRV
jgi:hypothetical protein